MMISVRACRTVGLISSCGGSTQQTCWFSRIPIRSAHASRLTCKDDIYLFSLSFLINCSNKHKQLNK